MNNRRRAPSHHIANAPSVKDKPTPDGVVNRTREGLPTVHESTLAKRYASALVALAEEQDQLEAVGGALNQFVELYRTTPAFRLLMTSPTAERKDQHAALGTFLDRSAPTEVVGNFLKLLVDKRRTALIEDIRAAFDRLVEVRAGRMTVDVASPVPLTDEHARRLQSILSEMTGKTVRLEATTDPSLLGGLVITMGSVMMDYSIRNHLNRLQAMMRG